MINNNIIKHSIANVYTNQNQNNRIQSIDHDNQKINVKSHIDFDNTISENTSNINKNDSDHIYYDVNSNIIDENNYILEKNLKNKLFNETKINNKSETVRSPTSNGSYLNRYKYCKTMRSTSRDNQSKKSISQDQFKNKK